MVRVFGHLQGPESFGPGYFAQSVKFLDFQVFVGIARLGLIFHRDNMPADKIADPAAVFFDFRGESKIHFSNPLD